MLPDQTPAARRAAACAAASKRVVERLQLRARPSAVAVSQSAKWAFLGSSGPWR